MRIILPDINSILSKLLDLETSFYGKKQRIASWVRQHRKEISSNRKLIKEKSDQNDLKILLMFLRGLMVRSMSGEAGERLYEAMTRRINKKGDLNEGNYKKALKEANYRWGVKRGTYVISSVVSYFRDELDWNWGYYLKEAKANRKTNFPDDPLLKIRDVGFKLRDLALSSFDRHYAAFDLHVTRIPTRIGLLNYGFDLLNDPNVEMGNNPGNDKNYLFLHGLFRKLSEMTDPKFLAVDLDRIFWHFGKAVCGANPRCFHCPIRSECLTGQHKT